MPANLKEIKKYAADQIKSGRPKEDVFNEIYSQCRDHRLFERIAGIIQYIPDPVRIEKYGIYNTLFLLLMISIDIAAFVTLNFWPLILMILFTILVAGKKTKYYLWITFTGGITFITVPLTGFLGFSETKELSEPAVVAIMVISILVIFSGSAIPKYLTPDYKIVEEIKIDDNGKEVKIKRISFN